MRKLCIYLFCLALLLLWHEVAATDALPLAPEWGEREQIVRVYHTRLGEIVEMPLEEYLVGVLAAEMPISYELEALKAQAVAARTYTVRKLIDSGGGGCRSRAGADICTGSGCCQAYADLDALHDRWGDRAGERMEKLARAVDETAGQLVTYQGEPIEALYHASSGGHTEDVEMVYAQALPYLRGVLSAGEEETSQYRATQELTAAKIAKALGVQSPSGPLGDWIAVLGRSETGRVTEIMVDGVIFTGTQFRRATGVRSSNFTMELMEETVRFDVLGFGHGVGMSQAGANAMAQGGASYVEILTWYYTGTSVG